MAKLEIGVDEAGRGAVLGPLVVAACALSPAAAELLRQRGVADSKSFGAPVKAQARRAALAEAIRATAEWSALGELAPAAVDAAVARGRLNELERETAEALLAGAPRWSSLVLDGAKLFGPLAARLGRAEARNRAEETSLAVAAASILAKAERDRLFSLIRSEYEPRFGPIRGEGYPNQSTERFLDAYHRATGELPRETRRSWSWPPVVRLRGPGGAPGPLSFDF